MITGHDLEHYVRPLKCWLVNATCVTGPTYLYCLSHHHTDGCFLSGVFVSSWLGSLLLQVGEWIIKKLPLVKHIYSAAKQVSAAVNPANETTQSFRECVLIRHPRNGEFAFGFITGQTLLQVTLLPLGVATLCQSAYYIVVSTDVLMFCPHNSATAEPPLLDPYCPHESFLQVIMLVLKVRFNNSAKQ